MFSHPIDVNNNKCFLELQRLFKEKNYAELECYLQSLRHEEDSLTALAHALLKNPSLEFSLFEACEQGHEQVVRLLILCGADVEQKNAFQHTPLTRAVRQGHVEIVKILLEEGKADPGCGKPNAIEMASHYPNDEINALFAPYFDRESDSLGNPSFDCRYSRQLVVDYTHIRAAEGLKYKWDNQHPDSPCQIISETDLSSGNVSLSSEAGDVTRIYINAHCSPGADSIKTASGSRIDFHELAEQLVKVIGDHDVVINLIACAAGKGRLNALKDDLSMASFASKLHQSLVLKANRDIPVVATMHLTSCAQKRMLGENGAMRTWEFGRKKTVDLNLSWTEGRQKSRMGELASNEKIQHQKGASVIYIKGKDGNQIKIDKHSYRWKAKVIQALKTAKSTTSVEKKKALFNRWLSCFKDMTPKAIYDEMSSEIAKPDSDLKAHDPYSLAKFFVYPAGYKTVKSLLEAGQSIFASRYTATLPVITGRKLS